MKIIAKVVAKAAKASAKAAVNSTSCIGLYQPAASKQMKDKIKSAKK